MQLRRNRARNKVSLILNLTCTLCGSPFTMDPVEFKNLGIHSIPKTCPTCLDKNQNRPDITISRKAIFETKVKIVSLPSCHWERVQDPKNDNLNPVYHAVVKGSHFGAEWNGRIDLWAIMPEPPKVGQVVKLTEMEVEKIVTKEKWSRETMHHGTVQGYKQVPLGIENTEEFKEKRNYVRLEPVEADKNTNYPELFWVEAYSKTTLKGLGRQYHVSLSGSPIWKKEISGGYRSGRASTTAWLTIVDVDNFVKLLHRENGEESSKYFPPEAESQN